MFKVFILNFFVAAILNNFIFNNFVINYSRMEIEQEDNAVKLSKEIHKNASV